MRTAALLLLAAAACCAAPQGLNNAVTVDEISLVEETTETFESATGVSTEDNVADIDVQDNEDSDRASQTTEAADTQNDITSVSGTPENADISSVDVEPEQPTVEVTIVESPEAAVDSSSSAVEVIEPLASATVDDEPSQAAVDSSSSAVEAIERLTPVAVDDEPSSAAVDSSSSVVEVNEPLTSAAVDSVPKSVAQDEASSPVSTGASPEAPAASTPEPAGAGSSAPVLQSSAPVDRTLRAVVHMRDDSGESKGLIYLKQVNPPNGETQIFGTVLNLNPGTHGLQIHQTGNMTSGCASTGDQFNPLQLAPAPAHPVEVDASGREFFRASDSQAALDGPNSVFGRSVVLHVGSQRTACGVIGRA